MLKFEKCLVTNPRLRCLRARGPDESTNVRGGRRSVCSLHGHLTIREDRSRETKKMATVRQTSNVRFRIIDERAKIENSGDDGRSTMVAAAFLRARGDRAGDRGLCVRLLVCRCLGRGAEPTVSAGGAEAKIRRDCVTFSVVSGSLTLSLFLFCFWLCET